MKAQRDHSPKLPLRLGCPVWNCEAWSGIVYPAKTPKREWLAAYSRMFNTVECNSSFYAIPAREHVTRWVRDSVPGFRFSMKFPREISHERQLVAAKQATQQFLEVLQILADGDRLGPSFLQLGPEFGPDRAHHLEAYLDQLPLDFPWAVEVRHLGWFDSGNHESRLDEMLRQRGIDKVLFDSRPLYQAPPDDAIERVSQSRKPKTPIRHTVTGKRPMLRIVGRNRIELVDTFLAQWSPIIARWIAAGYEPYIFTHAPNDAVAPVFAKRLWASLKPLLPKPQPSLPTVPATAKQLDLLFE